MSGETEQHISGWTVDTLKEFLLDKFENSEKLQVAKWEEQQRRNNDANEWRGTIGDLKRDFVPRTEHEALVQRFVTEQLSVGKMLASNSGERSGIGISWGAIVGAAGILVAVVTAITVVGAFRTSVATPQVVYVPAQPTPATTSKP